MERIEFGCTRVAISKLLNWLPGVFEHSHRHKHNCLQLSQEKEKVRKQIAMFFVRQREGYVDPNLAIRVFWPQLVDIFFSNLKWKDFFWMIPSLAYDFPLQMNWERSVSTWEINNEPIRMFYIQMCGLDLNFVFHWGRTLLPAGGEGQFSISHSHCSPTHPTQHCSWGQHFGRDRNEATVERQKNNNPPLSVSSSCATLKSG